MKNTVVLIDTDVLMDYITEREPFYENAEKIVKLRRLRLFDGYISSQCIANMFYILRKKFSIDERKEVLLGLCYLFSVCAINERMNITALEDKDFDDFEDCLQMQCAVNVNANYIVTRNIKDFEHSEVKAITPDTFLKMFT
jgi:predicted nucleic acid-binding protein